jgi:hypothetical protein
MSVTSVSRVPAYAETLSRRRLDAVDSTTVPHRSGDAAAISPQGFAALMHAQGNTAGGPPAMTDDLAGRLGGMLKQHDAEAFGRIDADQDGTLNASELSAAKEILGPPPGNLAQMMGGGSGRGSLFGSDAQGDLMTNLLNALLSGDQPDAEPARA